MPGGRAARAEIDVVVIGAGIVGLASAAAATDAGRSVVVVERNSQIAQESTSRNSGVIHAGIYYPPGSLKALLCTEGRELVYARCRSWRIPHQRLGKLIVATDEAEIATLEALEANARANGVPGLEMLEGREVARREPWVRARAALHSAQTGIVDAHALALSYQAEAEEHGAVIVLRSAVEAIEPAGALYRVETIGEDGSRAGLLCAAVVNAAGLASAEIAALAGIDTQEAGYRLRFCKGDYFSLHPGTELQLGQLIYPVPAAGGALGVHATLGLAGRIRFGPDAEFVDRIDYALDAGKSKAFAAAIQRYLPALRESWLSPEFAGIRPRLASAAGAIGDFIIAEESERGLPGIVNLIGIESPGLTAAPAIARRVVGHLASI